MPWEIYNWSATFASCSALFFPSLTVPPPLSVSERASALRQCISEKIALSTSLKVAIHSVPLLSPQQPICNYRLKWAPRRTRCWKLCVLSESHLFSILTLTFLPLWYYGPFMGAHCHSGAGLQFKTLQLKKRVSWHWGKSSFKKRKKKRKNIASLSTAVVFVLRRKEQRTWKKLERRRRRKGTKQTLSFYSKLFHTSMTLETFWKCWKA